MFGTLSSGLSALLYAPKMSEKKSPTTAAFSGLSSSEKTPSLPVTTPTASEPIASDRLPPPSVIFAPSSALNYLARLPPFPVSLSDAIASDLEAARANDFLKSRHSSSAPSVNTALSPPQTATSERVLPRPGYFAATSPVPTSVSDPTISDREAPRKALGSAFGLRLRKMRAAKMAELPSFNLDEDTAENKKSSTRSPTELDAPSTTKSSTEPDGQSATIIGSENSANHIAQSFSGVPDDPGTRIEENQSELELPPMKEAELSSFPVRTARLTPQKPTSKLSFRPDISKSRKTTLLTPILKEMEFVITLSMSARVRDQYVSVIRHYEKEIDGFLKDEDPSYKNLEKIRKMLDQVRNITTHQDIDGERGLSQGQEAAEMEVTWAEGCSAKFQFLRRFLESVRHKDVHIAIVARSGRLHDIIETYLQGIRVKYSRPGTLARSVPNASRGRLGVILVASGVDGNSIVPQAADLVIAFDSSFNVKDAQVGLLRDHLVNVGDLSPVIHLIVYKSIEHIERCIPESKNPVERLKKIVHYLVQTQHKVGKLELDDMGTAAFAEEATMILEGGGLEKYDAFPSIRPIETVQWGLMSSQSEEQPGAEKIKASHLLRLKRGLDTEDESSTPQKRQRSATINGNAHDSLWADATPPNYFEFQDLVSERDLLRKENCELKSNNETLLENLESVKTLYKKQEQRLKETEQNRWKLEQSLGELLDRFTEKTLKLTQAQLEKEDRAKAEEKLRMQATKMAESCAQLEEELGATRAALLSSSVPAVAELEGLKAELRTLRTTQANTEKKLASQSHDYEYMRQEYQKSSTSAAESAGTIRRLEEELAVAQDKAQGEAAKLAQINQNNNSEQARSHIKQLKTQLSHREKLLQKQADELKDFRRGRNVVGAVTRGSSVHSIKSPKGGRSRAGSPSAGLNGGRVGSNLRYGIGVGGMHAE